jgi:hypothetical protein
MSLGRYFNRRVIASLFVGALSVVTPIANAADSLTWRKDKNSVDADVNSWSLIQTLEKIGEATGWEIYLEPGTKRNVSTTFKNRPRDKALDFLLGDLGRVLLPQTNGQPARLLVFRSTQKDATLLVSKPKEDPTTKPIPNELVVTLKPGESIDELAKKLGAKVTGRNDALNTYRLEFENAEAAKAARADLAQNPAVESIDNNYNVRRPETGDNMGLLNPAGINLDPVAPTCASGSGPTIGLIDAAVQKTGAAYDALMLPSVNVAGEPLSSATVPAHGTGMAQAILQAVSQKQQKTEWRVRPYNVYGPNEQANTFDVANGISRAIADGANPINMSLGTGGDSSFLHRVIQNGHKQGIVFVGAAGNEPTTAPTYPGAYPEVIAVTAGNADGTVASYANRGDFVDVLAPGQVRITFNGQTWVTTGTSVSTALVSGIAAGSVNGGCVTGDQLRAGLQSLMRVPSK